MEEQKQSTPATHIAPSVGRVVWFWDEASLRDSPFQPMRADICFVNEDGTVNLSVNNHEGEPFTYRRCTLHQGDAEGCNLPRPFATWMPYQKGQAAKTEAAEKAEAPRAIGGEQVLLDPERGQLWPALDLQRELLAEQVRQLRLQNDAQEMANEQRRRETGASRIDAKLAGNLASAIC